MKSHLFRFSAVAIAVVAAGSMSSLDARTYAMKINLKVGQPTSHNVSDITELSFSEAGAYQLTATPYAGEEATLNLAKVEAISFEGTNLVIGDVTLPVSSIKQIVFADNSSALPETLLGDAITVEALDGTLTATHSEGADLDVTVYSPSGITLAAAKGQGSVAVDLNALSTGTLIVKINNKIIKLTR